MGAPIKGQTHFTPLSTQHFFSGLVTQRGFFNGLDSRYYTRWMGQRTDYLLAGKNIELTNYGTLIRRPGLIPYSTATLASPAIGFYPFRQIKNIANPIDVIVDTATTVYKLTPSAATTIFTKSTGAGQCFFQGVGNTLYMGDGVDLLAWQDPGSTRNWGISIGPFSGASGPNQCGAGTDVSVGGGSTWTNPNTVSTDVTTGGTTMVLTQVAVSAGQAVYSYSSYTGVAPAINMMVAFSGFATAGNNVVAQLTAVSGGASGTVTVTATTQVNETHAGSGSSTAYVQVGNIPSANVANTPGVFAGWDSASLPVSVTIAAGATSAQLNAYNLGFSIPSNATIQGVAVSMTRQQLSGTSAMYSINIGLAGVSCSTKSDGVGQQWTGSPTVVTYGSSSDLWSAILTPNVINSSAFGINMEVDCTGGPGNGASGQLTTFTVTVYYTTPQTNLSDLLEAKTFGFNLTPTTTIQGLQVSIEGCQSASNPSASSLTVQLLKNGSPVGTPVSNIQLSTVNGTVNIGGDGNLFGDAWSASDISTTTFGVAVQAFNSNSSTVAYWYIASVKVTIWATGGPAISVTGSGSFSATVGYQYVVAYGNSNSGHVSSATPLSAGTGVFSGKAGVNVTLVASNDSQVNQIWVFRTTDGGSTLLNLPTSPYANANATITDNNSDESLVVTQQAPINDANDPPPAGMVKMCYHLGRVWGAVGNTLYYSAGPDCLLGNGAEAFPPANSFVFPTQINRLVPTSTVLLVYTASDLYYIAGTSTLTFYPMPLQTGLGLLSYNALTTEGNNTWMFSADRQFLRFSSAGINEDGYNIGNLLDGTIQNYPDSVPVYDPSLVYVASHINGSSDKAVFIGDGSSSWLRCNWNQPPEGGPAWSPRAVITGGYTSFGSIEVSPGNRRLLVGMSNGTVAMRSLSTFTDLGTSYTASATIGSIVLAQPGQLADVESITVELPNIGSVPTIGVLLDEVSGTFETLSNYVDDPPVLSTSTSIMSKRFYLMQQGDCIQCRHMQLQLGLVAEPVRNEIETLSIWGALEGHE